MTRAVQSQAGGRKENEKITRAVQSRAQERPVALSVRLLLRFLACWASFSFFSLFFVVLVFVAFFVRFWIVLGGHFGRFLEPSSAQDGS